MVQPVHKLIPKTIAKFGLDKANNEGKKYKIITPILMTNITNNATLILNNDSNNRDKKKIFIQLNMNYILND